MMSPEQFEAMLRHELKQRDAKRRMRLGDAAAYAAADAELVATVMDAAGFAPPEEAERVVRKGRRRAALNEGKAFGEPA